MTYAVLSFASTVTAGQRLKDMAKVITGAATSVTDLEFATQASSEIIAAESAGWTLADADSALEASGTATKVEYRFSAPCVNTNKTKYAAIAAYALYYRLTTGTVTNTKVASNSTTGYLYLFGGGGVSGGALLNPGVLPLTFTSINQNDMYYYPAINIGSAAQYIISVTNRKIIILGPSASSASINSLQSILEFPETSSAIVSPNTPSVSYNYYAQTATTNSSVVTATSFSTDANVDNFVYKLTALINWYRYSSNNRTTRVAEDATNFMYCPTVPVAGIDPATGLTQNPLIPLLDFRQAFGEGTHDYSSLTNLYFTRSINHLDTITVGGDTYVSLRVNDRSFCVKKA